MRLNERQRRFADEYIKTGNIEQSALSAGYSKNYARGRSHELLSNVGIKNYVEERLEELQSKRVADQQEILELLTSVARGELRASTLIGLGGGAEEIEEKMPPTMNERIKAAELLGKRYAMWTERQEIENVTPTFVEDVPEDDD